MPDAEERDERRQGDLVPRSADAESSAEASAPVTELKPSVIEAARCASKSISGLLQHPTENAAGIVAVGEGVIQR